ncbi:hypothetical protein KUC_2150 [Vreelandella boliviensis LC1]|uniref:Uncharacterized protein n=1 Tax=Vreelandella boliviensis LC1 TaxID=1072583 RepID=A0A7U9GGQ9_9GAMM|nr:hypothetical protein KUC_2150 [Halomonas boliviensis LC1]
MIAVFDVISGERAVILRKLLSILLKGFTSNLYRTKMVLN